MRRAAIAMVMFVWAITMAAAEDAAIPAAGKRDYSAEWNAASRLPGAALNLNLAAPIATWDEAIPLGNGLLGGLLWSPVSRKCARPMGRGGGPSGRSPR